MAQGVLTQSTGILHHPPGGWSNAASNHFKQAALLWRNIKEQRHTSPPYIPGIVETSSSQAPTVRRRLRRRVRSRAFTNARTATRSFDLPLAIGDPSISLPPASPSSVHRWIPASARRPQRRAFCAMVPVAPLYIRAARPATSEAVPHYSCLSVTEITGARPPVHAGGPFVSPDF